MSKQYRSWAHAPSQTQRAVRPAWGDFDWPDDMAPVLPYGNGRSYGDSCLNSAGSLIDARGLKKIISFDTESGVLHCEPGLLLAELLECVVPKGWFLPITPGTSHVTVGGALANDVHGKNHHRDGCFGNHVLGFGLRRSNGVVYRCSSKENTDWFCATVGGMGLTGFVTDVKLKLLPIESSSLDVETLAFANLDAFYRLSSESEASHQYVVAWLDCMAKGKHFGRGIFLRANHSRSSANESLSYATESSLSVPFNCPSWCLGSWFVRCFNQLYYFYKSKITSRLSRQSLNSFFYPLDSIGNWNRIYGKRGFYQCQFVIPRDSESAMEGILKTIVDSGQSSFLAVLKEFGSVKSPGLMSFPRPGLCLALDFPDRGDSTVQLLANIEQQVIDAGGAMYPAKDRCMSASGFKQFFPKYEEFKQFVDPAITSDFWRRVDG